MFVLYCPKNLKHLLEYFLWWLLSDDNQFHKIARIIFLMEDFQLLDNINVQLIRNILQSV